MTGEKKGKNQQILEESIVTGYSTWFTYVETSTIFTEERGPMRGVKEANTVWGEGGVACTVCHVEENGCCLLRKWYYT